MSEQPPQPGPAPGPGDVRPVRAFRWQALFQHSTDALFVLDRRRRILFVNRAWEALAGLPAEQACGLVCRHPRPPGPRAAPEDVLAHALTPPAEALQGRPAQARRLLPARAGAPICWDVEFFPLRLKESGVFILGRATLIAAEPGMAAPPLPERLVALRERAARRFGLDLLASSRPAMRRLSEQVRLAGQVRVPILLVGEAGTGKRTLARVIHYQGADRERSFAGLDCERLPPAAVANVLFGERRSALGSIYLREPQCLPRDLQLRLLDALAEPTDAEPGEAPPPRIFAGLHARPADEVRAGRLLEGLACALSTLVLELPPLRERRDDLPALVQQLLERTSAEGEARGAGLTPAAWDLIRGHAWPGNLRELSAVLTGAREAAKGNLIDADNLPAPLRLAQRVEQAPGGPAERPLPLPEILEQVERRLIELALRRARGNKTRAAELLSIWRPRLVRRMAALKMEGAETEGGEGT